MTLETTLAVVRDLRGWLGQPVWVVAGGAAELTFGGGETATRFHLLDVPNGFECALVSLFHEKHCQESVERQARAEVKRKAAGACEAELTLEMALLTDRFP